MKKLGVLATLMFATFLAIFFPATAIAGVEGDNPQLVLDSPTPDQIKDYSVLVPKDAPIGYNVMTVQIYDGAGVQSERHIYFCKEIDQSIHWDNKCPNVFPVASRSDLGQTTDLKKLPNYNPAQDYKKSAGLVASAVALMILLANAGAKFAEDASATFLSLSADQKFNGKPIKRAGDWSFTWKFPGGRYTDRFFSRTSRWLSRRSLVFSRVIGDGDYGRAMFGLLWVAFYIGAPALGYWIARDTGFVYSPPRVGYLLALIGLGVIDSLAGLLASLTFVISTLIANHPHQVNEVLLLLAIATLGFAPVLIAAATRTFRRFTNSSHDRWEKLVDYALAPVIGMWSVMKIIEGLNGFIGKQFFVSFLAIPIGIFTGIVLLLRMFWEEFANRVYTWRVSEVATDYQEQTLPWKFVGFLISTLIATYLAYRFSSWTIYLAAAMALGYLPKLVRLLLRKELPTSKWLQYITPKGLFLTLLLIFTASSYQSLVKGHFTNSKTFLVWWVFLSAIPAFIFDLISFFRDKSADAGWKKHPFFKYFWRFGAIVVYGALFVAIFQIAPKTVFNLLFHHDWNQITYDIQKFFALKS